MGRRMNQVRVLPNRPDRHPGCIRCGRPIVYGDRCPPCAQGLRLRRKRKPG